MNTKQLAFAFYLSFMTARAVSYLLDALSDYFTYKLEVLFHGDLIAAQEFTLKLIYVTIFAFSVVFLHMVLPFSTKVRPDRNPKNFRGR